jgi:hypothetical protein
MCRAGSVPARCSCPPPHTTSQRFLLPAAAVCRLDPLPQDLGDIMLLIVASCPLVRSGAAGLLVLLVLPCPHREGNCVPACAPLRPAVMTPVMTHRMYGNGSHPHLLCHVPVSSTRLLNRFGQRVQRSIQRSGRGRRYGGGGGCTNTDRGGLSPLTLPPTQDTLAKVRRLVEMGADPKHTKTTVEVGGWVDMRGWTQRFRHPPLRQHSPRPLPPRPGPVLQ